MSDAGNTGLTAPLVNKAEMAKKLGISLPTLTAWMDRYPEFPVRDRGTNGRNYRFAAEDVFEFLSERKAEEAAREGARDEALAQLQLPMELLPRENLPKSTVKDEIDAWRLRKIQREEAVAAGTLVSAEDVRQALRSGLTRLNRGTVAFVRQLGREHNWPDSYMTKVEERLAEVQRASVAELQEAAAAGDGQLALV